MCSDPAAIRASHVLYAWGSSESFSVTDRIEGEDLVIQLAPGARVTGVVRAGGEPIEGAVVRLSKAREVEEASFAMMAMMGALLRAPLSCSAERRWASAASISSYSSCSSRFRLFHSALREEGPSAPRPPLREAKSLVPAYASSPRMQGSVQTLAR